MKKILLVFYFISILGISAYSKNSRIELTRAANKVECTDSRLDGFSAKFSFNAIDFSDIDTPEGVFSAISINGAYNSGECGAPQLPAFHKLIYIPNGSIPHVIVKNYTVNEYKLSDYEINTLYPAQRSYSKSEKIEDMKFSYNKQSYLASKSQPNEIATIEILGSMREIGIGKLFINPVVYNYEEGIIRIYNNIDIDVTFENADSFKSSHDIKNSFSPYFKDVYNRLFNSNIINNSVKSEPGDLMSYPVKMLVIANRMFEEALQPWINWKIKKGFEVDVNYTDIVGSTATELKAFCAAKYNEGLESGNAPSFVIIVGDVEQVPASALGNKSEKMTDLYYGSIDGDMYPEMYFSRISVINPSQLTGYINKLIYYEKYEFEDASYLNNVTLIAGADNYWNPLVGKPTVRYWTENYFNLENGFNVNYWLGSPYTNCYNTINDGLGLINYTAHGYMDEWSDPKMSISMVNNLTNTNKYSIAIGNCCLAADFGYGVCFGEAWIRAENKGAVGYIGSSPSSYWYEDFYWGVGAFPFTNSGATPTLEGSGIGVYDAFFNDTFRTLCGMATAGNMAVDEAVSKNYSTSVGSLYYWQAYNILGDGSIMPYIGEGKVNPVEHLSLLFLGLDSFEAKAQPGSYLSISKDNVIYGTGVADENGNAKITFSKNIESNGPYDLVITRAGYIPYFATLQPASLDTPYLVFNSCVVDNAEKSLIFGNEETISLTIENVGEVATAGNVTVTLSCDDPYLTFIDNSEVYPVIEGKGKASVNGGFKVKISPETENNHSFIIKFKAESGEESWTGKFELKSIAPIVKYVDYSVNDGSLIKGNINDMNIKIENIGSYVAKDTEVLLTCDSEYVIVVNKESYKIGDLSAGNNSMAIFKVYVASNVPIGHTANFNVKIETDSEYISSNSHFSIPWGDYCTPETTNCTSDKIIDIIFAGITNIGTGCSTDGYGDYTSMIGEVEAGNTYTFYAKAGYANDKIYAWIDYNENGEFEESELAVINLVCSNANSTYNRDVTIPDNVLPGTKRMRVRSFWAQGDITPDPCTKVTQYGETEDYTIKVITPYLEPNDFVINWSEGQESITIKWSAPEKNATPDGYKLYRNDDLVTTGLIEDLSFLDSPKESGFYIYKLIAVYGDNESIPLFGFIDFVKPNSINELQNSASIYPNPANTIINIKSNNIETISLFDLSGRLVKDYDVYNDFFTINTSSLQEGVYLMNIKSTNGIIRKNIIIKH